MSRTSSTRMIGLVLGAAVLVSACSGDLSQDPEDAAPQAKAARDFKDENESLFKEGGVALSDIVDGGVFGGNQDGGSLPVNKFLWQASLDTLSFLPLASTDPFTGVIATDWGASPTDPAERFKVTAYMVRPALAASSLKVAVYRELRNGEGIWVPAPVDPETSRKLEDAILVRARQIRIAELEGSSTG